MTESDNYLSIKELLDVFNDIDLKIRELHRNSSQVFMQLNDFLKEYSKKNNIVSTNVSRIFESIAGENYSSLSLELENVLDNYGKFKTGTDNEFDVNLLIKSKLNTKVDNLLLSFQNLKHDLLTLKFLFSNFKVISGNDDEGEIIYNEIKSCEQTLDIVMPVLSRLELYTATLGTEIYSLNNTVRSHSQKCASMNVAFCNELRSSVLHIRKKNMESGNYIPEMRDKLNSTSGFIENIITHLQYHDIIKQKIDHIQNSHEKIIERLNEKFEADNNIIVNNDDEILSFIEDISGLQSAQLILISKEYQKAIDVISENFQKIVEDLTTISTVSHEFSLDPGDSETTFLNVVKERLDIILLVLDEYNSSKFNNDLLGIKSSVDKICNTVYHSVINPLRTLEHVIIPDNRLKNKSGNRPSIVDQIATLRQDIFKKCTELKRELSYFKDVSETFQVQVNNSGFRTNMEEEQIKVMVEISKVLGQLDEQSKNLDSVLDENRRIKKDIIDRLKSTLNQVDYNELFERLLDDIINQLNMVNSRLKLEGDINKNRKVNNLKVQEEYYTVASERVVHSKVINDDFNTDITYTDDYDTDVELF